MTANSPEALSPGWSVKRLGDIAEESVVRVPDPGTSGLERFVGSASIERHAERVTAWEPVNSVTSAAKRFEAGDYLLVRRSLYGSDFRERAPRADFAGICSADIIVIREKSEALVDGFLQHLLYESDFWQFITANSTGSITRRIKWHQIADWKFRLPPLEEQQRIVTIMQAVEQARDCYRTVCHNGSGLRAALLNQLDAEAPRIPLGSVASIQRGSSYKSEDYSAQGIGRPFLTLKSVSREGQYAPDGLKWVREDFDPSRRAAPGDLFLANTDLTPGRLLVGAPFFFPGEESTAETAYSMDLSKVAITDPSLSVDFLYFALSTPRIRQEMRLHSGGSTVSHLRLASVPKIEIPVPSPPRQQELVAQLTAIDRAVTAVIKAGRAALPLSRRVVDVLGGPSGV